MRFSNVINESGLTKIELATLYGVSRQTIHAWAFIGPPRRNSLLARQAESITDALETLTSRKLLPLEPMDKDARRAHIAKLAEKLQALKPAPVR
jgi:transcriptional regulator with XRE-family HTH domain